MINEYALDDNMCLFISFRNNYLCERKLSNCYDSVCYDKTIFGRKSYVNYDIMKRVLNDFNLYDLISGFGSRGYEEHRVIIIEMN